MEQFLRNLLKKYCLENGGTDGDPVEVLEILYFAFVFMVLSGWLAEWLVVGLRPNVRFWELGL